MRDKIVDAFGKLWSTFDVPWLGCFRFELLSMVYRVFPLIGGINYPRLAEWQFVMRHLPSAPAKVLDVGSTSSLFPFKLEALGYETHCLDQRLPYFRLPKAVIFHQDDLMRMRIPDNSFDAVTCISVIEHVGMGKYDDPKTPEPGDSKSIKEMLRILKPGGRLIITTNTCRCTVVHNDEIRYGKDRIESLLALGTSVIREYRCFDGRKWIACGEAAAFQGDPDHFGIGLFVLTKG